MRLPDRSLTMLSGTGLVLLLLAGPRALGAATDACSLVPLPEVAQIIGNDAPTFRQQPPIDRDGVKVSSCVYQQAGAANTGNVQFNTYESAAAAQTGLKQYVDAMAKLGATIAADTAGRLPATFVTTQRGSGEMYVVKGNVLLGAGVATVSGGKVVPLQDRSRALLAAAIAKF